MFFLRIASTFGSRSLNIIKPNLSPSNSRKSISNAFSTDIITDEEANKFHEKSEDGTLTQTEKRQLAHYNFYQTKIQKPPPKERTFKKYPNSDDNTSVLSRDWKRRNDLNPYT